MSINVMNAADVQGLAAQIENTETGTISNVQVTNKSDLKKIIEDIERQFVENGGYALFSTNEYDELDNEIKQRYWYRIDSSGETIMILEEPYTILDIMEDYDNVDANNLSESDCIKACEFYQFKH